MNALIVEDEGSTRRIIAGALSSEGISVTAVSDVAAGQSTIRFRNFDIVILDLTLTDGSGLELLRMLRQGTSDTHVIVVSGAAGEVDRVRALLSGADDYIVKPFFPRELAARAVAVGRRLQLRSQNVLRDDWLRVDLAARLVTVGDSSVSLTTKEFDLLAYLASRPGKAFSREELLRSVWNSTSAWQRPTTVTEHVRRLRAKLGDTPPSRLVAIRSIGYRYDPPQPTTV